MNAQLTNLNTITLFHLSYITLIVQYLLEIMVVGHANWPTSPLYNVQGLQSVIDLKQEWKEVRSEETFKVQKCSFEALNEGSVFLKVKTSLRPKLFLNEKVRISFNYLTKRKNIK